MAAFALVNISVTDGTVQYARVDTVDRPDLYGTPGAEAIEALVADGWDPRGAVPVLVDGSSVTHSVALTR